ncbi:MAG TPA: sigma-70 family RNA polymerase sigma factor [Trebonia sp.]|nr:sigma-70 family RNA polymerase sigma factor [Trebonia sp.]
MRDSEVVAAIAAGEPDGLAAAYDRYADPLHTYCRTITGDPADAADAVQDAFVLAAARIGTLRDPGRLRPWLYSIARNQCLRTLRNARRSPATGEVPEVSDPGGDIGAGAEQAERVALVQAALSGLNPGEREVIELTLRQDLDPGEVALVLGVSRNHVHALLSRAREQLLAGLAVLLVGRAGREDCHELGSLLGGWDGTLTATTRKRVHRHIERCGTCTTRRASLVNPAALLPAGGVALAVLAAPAGLRAEVLRLGLSHEAAAVAHRAAAAKAAGAFGRGGFPKPVHGVRGAGHHPPWHTSPQGQATIAAAVVIAVAIASAAFALSGHSEHVTLSSTLPRTSAPPPPAPASLASPAAPAAPPGRPRGPGASPTAARPAAGATPSPASAGGPTARATVAGAGPQPTTPGRSAPPATPPGRPATTAPPGQRTTPPPAPPTTRPSATPLPPAAGTLAVTPGGGGLPSGPGGSSVLLEAVGGPVSWSITPAGHAHGSLSVSPSAGTLAAGTGVRVTITADLLAVGDKLTVSPGGVTFTIVIGW